MKPPVDTPKIDLDWVRNATEAALTRRQTAKLLGVDERTVTRAIDAGEIPSIRMGRRVLVPRLPLLRKLGVEHDRAPDDPELQEARRRLRAQRFEDRIAEIVAEAPDLTDDVRNRISALLRTGSDDVDRIGGGHRDTA